MDITSALDFLSLTLLFLQILEPCQNSLAYQPPNPWTMGILGLLAEIYLMPNLKMNLKFDIEVQENDVRQSQTGKVLSFLFV